jgi:hypothetical protein
MSLNLRNALSNAFVGSGGGADATKLPLTGGSLTGAVSIPTASGFSIASARANGLVFGASLATANEGITSFNNRLCFFAQGENFIYGGLSEFRFAGSVWLEWAATAATSGARTLLSGGLADNTLQMGKASATPIDQTFKGPNGSGTNIAGGDIRIAPGQSTGDATPATVVLQGTAAGSSGTTAQTLVDLLTVGDGLVKIESGNHLQLGNGAALEAVIASHTLIIQDVTGTNYKVLCVPA